jgi:hypothetical protein
LLKENKFFKEDLTWKVGSGGYWFAIYKKPGLNLTKKPSLLSVLPEKRNHLAKFYADLFIYAIEILEEFCLKHASITLKTQNINQ